MADYRKLLLDAKRMYRAKNYSKAYEIYSMLYERIPFDNSAKYSYAWAIYQSRVRDYIDEQQLIEDVELITRLTRQNDLNRTQLCVYTMSVIKLVKLLYSQEDYEGVLHWLSKLNPDLLDEVRFTRDGEVFPSNRENYYVYASVSHMKLENHEKCIEVSMKALNSLTRFTRNNAAFFQWRIAKSLRQIGEYARALKYLKEVQRHLDEWYVYHEMAENYFYLEDYDESLEYALKSALKDGPMDMKFKLYSLLEDLLVKSHPSYAAKHERLMEMIRLDDDVGKTELEDELVGIWRDLSG